jgi:superfamily II DNA or RNA helicase
MILRPYQGAVLSATYDALNRGRHPLIVMPTGAGKTVCFVSLAREFPGRVCILMHRRELIEQTCRALAPTPHGIIQSGVRPRPDLRIQVASVGSLVRRTDWYKFDLIIVDEAHHTTAASYQRIVAAYPGAQLMGVTATPCRTDGTGLRDAGFDELILGPSVAELTAMGYLTPAKVYIPTGGESMKGVPVRGGDYAKGALTKRVLQGDPVVHYRRYADRHPAIAFCVSVEHAEHTAERFQAAGYRAASIDGSMTPMQRRDLIEGLACGDIHVLTSCDLISEGVDVPVVSCGIMLRPTLSTGLWMQQMGRCLRPAGGKAQAIILDHYGNSLLPQHGLPETPRVWSLDGIAARAQDEDAEPATRWCPACLRAHETAPVCPYCGFEHPKRETRQVIEVSGELALWDAQWDALGEVSLERRQEWDCQTLADFQELGKQRGHAPGWAWHRWNARKRKGAA